MRAAAAVPVQKKEPEGSGAGDTALCGEESQSGAERPAAASSTDTLCSMAQRQPNFVTVTCRKYGMWVTLRHNLGGRLRNALFSSKWPGLLWYSTSAARFPDGYISVQTMK